MLDDYVNSSYSLLSYLTLLGNGLGLYIISFIIFLALCLCKYCYYAYLIAKETKS